MAEKNKIPENKDFKDIEDKNADTKNIKQKTFFSKSKILVLVCVLFIATLFIGFQNCAREHSFSSSNPCVIVESAEGENNRCTEIFIPGVSPKATDVLFIVDTSSSMSQEQDEMSKKFGSFVDQIGNVDFQIGIITTDPTNSRPGDRGQLLDFTRGIRYLTPNTSNLESLFKSKVKAGIKGSTTEKPFLCATKAIEERDAHNQGFFRDDADLTVVILTDEDGYDDNKNGFFTKFEEVWPNKSVTVHGIAAPSREKCPEANSAGPVVHEAARETGGFEGSICAKDYGPLLSIIGKSVASSIILTFPPVSDSMKITLEDGSELNPGDYTINKNKVVIKRGLRPGARITFDYEYQL